MKYGVSAGDAPSVDRPPVVQPAIQALDNDTTSDMSFAREFITRVLPGARHRARLRRKRV
jgi:hypothetical protein